MRIEEHLEFKALKKTMSEPENIYIYIVIKLLCSVVKLYIDDAIL